MTEQKKPTYVALDIAKFLCALLILCYHYFSEHKVLPSFLEECLSLYAVAVALFMAISGFLTFDKLRTVQGTTQRWSYVWKQVKRILRVYLLWSIPYLVFTVSQWEAAEISLSFVLRYIRSWVFSSTFYTIWFMPALALGLIVVFWVTEKLPKPAVWGLATLCYILGTCMLTYAFAGGHIPGFFSVANFSALWLGGARGWLFFAFPLLLVGKTAAECKDRFRLRVMLPAAFGGMILVLAEALLLRRFVGHTGIDMLLTMPPAVFCILGFLLTLPLHNGAYALWMRKMSVLIFMSQRLFLTVLPAVVPLAVTQAVFANGYIGALAVCGGTIGLSALLIALSSKVTFLKKLY